MVQETANLRIIAERGDAARPLSLEECHWTVSLILLSANGHRARLGRVPITGIPAHRKFPDKLTINQATALPEFV